MARSPLAVFVKSFGRVATQAIGVAAAAQQTPQRGMDASRCTPCAAKAAVAAARAQARGQR